MYSMCADASKKRQLDAEEPLLGGSEEDVTSQNEWQSIGDLLSYSTPDTPLLLAAFAAGTVSINTFSLLWKQFSPFFP